MKSIDLYLYRHNNGTYYYRYSFPPFLNYNSFEIIISLKTSDLSKAKSYILNLRLVTNNIIERFRSDSMRIRNKAI